MKPTGSIRRIDDLGRITIPAKIRKDCQIEEGDAFEIFITENNAIVLKPYSKTHKKNPHFHA